MVLIEKDLLGSQTCEAPPGSSWGGGGGGSLGLLFPVKGGLLGSSWFRSRVAIVNHKLIIAALSSFPKRFQPSCELQHDRELFIGRRNPQLWSLCLRNAN